MIVRYVLYNRPVICTGYCVLVVFEIVPLVSNKTKMT